MQTLIRDQITANAELKDDRDRRGLLIKLWREAEASESIRLERKAKGVGPDDLEDPLPEGDFATDVTAFDRVIHWEPALSELLCEPLYGRIKREAKRANTHSVILLERVRTAAEVSRVAVGKTLSMTPGIALRVMGFAMPQGPRDWIGDGGD